MTREKLPVYAQYTRTSKIFSIHVDYILNTESQLSMEGVCEFEVWVRDILSVNHSCMRVCVHTQEYLYLCIAYTHTHVRIQWVPVFHDTLNLFTENARMNFETIFPEFLQPVVYQCILISQGDEYRAPRVLSENSWTT
jgi:hypothetical protein